MVGPPHFPDPAPRVGLGPNMVETVSSSVSLSRRTFRLRKVRWNIYQKIRLDEKDVASVLGYYRSLIKRFLKRFSAKLKPREPAIWKEKLSKTVIDVTKFLREKMMLDSTCETSTLNSKSSSKAGAALDAFCKPKKKAQFAKSVTTHFQQKCTCYTIMTEYMSKVDSALLMLSTILYLVRNEQTKFKDKHFEVPAVETLDNDLKDVIEAADEPIVTMVAEDEASVKKTDNDNAKEVAEANTEETAASVMEPVNKDSKEYKQRIKDASNKFLAASGVLNKICPRGFHVGYSIVDCKCEVKVKQSGCPHRKWK